MNYYEELGVNRSARTEEIRQAYKTLARLLHPDSQSDEKLRAMGERQMQRLNEILGLLTDPQRRHAYDANLEGPRPVNPPDAQGEIRRPGLALSMRHPAPVKEPLEPGGMDWLQSAVRYWFWVLIGATCLGTAAFWLMWRPERNVPEVLPVHSVPPAATELERGVPGNLRSPKRRVPTAQPAADPAARLSDTLERSEPESMFPEAAEPMFGRREAAEMPVTEAAALAPSSSPFAGSWLYVAQVEKAASLENYPAIYVECLLAQEGGDLVGSYRARYKVADKALWLEIALRLRGKAPSGKSAQAEWTSANGARGLLEMKIRAPGQMTVRWWTTEFASQAQLTSGTARLVRQQTP